MHLLIRKKLGAVACASAAAAMLVAYAQPASAAAVGEVESNDSIASAQNLDDHFTLEADPNITNSTTVPHATVNGTGNGTVDFYSFSVPQAGAASIGVFDIDGGMFSFDSWLHLYDSNGNLLRVNDDAAVDAGSVHPFDSFMQYNFPTAGTYYIAVGRFPSLQPIPTGASYQLHVSVPNHLGGVAYLLEQLDAQIRSYGLPASVQDPLLFKVSGAQHSLEEGRLDDVCGRMADLDRRVNEMLARNRLTGTQATEILAASARIADMLACP